MAYKARTLEDHFQLSWNFWKNRTDIQRTQYAWSILLAYRFIAIGVALTLICIIQIDQVSLLSTAVVAAGITAYTILKTGYSFFSRPEGSLNLILLAVDVVVCFFLVEFTAGLSSPYLLYTLSPVLTAAFFMDRKVAASVAFLSAFYVLGGHIFNPFFKTVITDTGLSYFFFYLTCVCLAAALPYLINFNLRQSLRSQDTLLERERLSREIHDGSVQTLAALSWQVQIVQRKLSQIGVEIPETRRLEELAEKAQQDALTSLNVLREGQQKGEFVDRLEKALALPGPAVKTRIYLESKNISLSPYVEHELLRICQEAVVNIKKHSGARNARINIKSVDRQVEVVVADDGRGFDINSYCRGEGQYTGHGLGVMQERAESIGGKFRVVSQPGQGTQIHLVVPASRKGKLWGR